MDNIGNFLRSVSYEDFSFPSYMVANIDAFSRNEPPEPIYTVETTHRVYRVGKKCILGALSVFFPLYGLYRLIHVLSGKIIVPAQNNKNHLIERLSLTQALCGLEITGTFHDGNQEKTVYLFKTIIKDQKGGISFVRRVNNSIELRQPLEENKSNNYFVPKRICILVDGEKIDAWILGRKKTLNNRRWTLYSNGNAGTIENTLAFGCKELVKQMDHLESNLLFYNYQGVGGSEGRATRNGIINAHKAMLQFLEDEILGIGANVIIQDGWSLGGGVLGEAMKTHSPKDGIKYLCIQRMCFSKLSRVPKPLFGKLIRFFAWEIETLSSAEILEQKNIVQIIIQKGRVHELHAVIEHDRVISGQASLAFELQNKAWNLKKFILISCNHFNVYEVSSIDPESRLVFATDEEKETQFKRLIKVKKSQENQEILDAIQEALEPDFVGFPH